MARFTNYATLSYNGGSTDSNTVTGELLETLSMTKTAVTDTYTVKDAVTYVISIVNSATVTIGSLTLTDNLGGYLYNENTLYPLAYREGSLRYYANGVLQTALPTVTSGPPLSISGISVPAGGSVLLIYETSVTNFAPLGNEASVSNTAILTGNGIATPLTAQAITAMKPRAELSISKSICPNTVTENGTLTYTFVIENNGSTATTEADAVALSDTFNPRLSAITVTFNGVAWTENTHYTYDENTGVFATLPGQITVPAATYTQGETGAWAVTPGTATLVVSGTV